MHPRLSPEDRPSNIGWQFDNVGTYVLTPGSFAPVVRGAVGELCVSGPLVGKGYHHRPDLTTERFPYHSAYGQRIYRTGDYVRLLHDDSFDFVGRIDTQVKLRGQRLEVDEINSVIKRSCGQISNAATTVARLAPNQNEQLFSFLVTKDSLYSQDVVIIDQPDHQVLELVRDA
ncbi:non-ribosomal peptide synthetase nps2, partial [Elasticomyces elasticus]